MPSLPSFSFQAFGAPRGTFVYDQDAHPSNVEHWLEVLGAVQRRDVERLAEHLPLASGAVRTRTRSGAVRKGRLPHRIESMLVGHDGFEDRLLQEARADVRWFQPVFHGSPAEYERLVAEARATVQPRVSALQLVMWVVPDLVAPVLRAMHAQAWTTSPPTWARSPTRWIGEQGRLRQELADGGVAGEGPWNPCWPEVVGALAIAALDQRGHRAQREAAVRDQGRVVYREDDGTKAWLSDQLHRKLTRPEDDARFEATIVPRAAGDGAMTVWDRALSDVLDQGDRQAWDLGTWQGWARRWMLATGQDSSPERLVQVASAFWQRWPDERLPLLRSDSIATATLMAAPAVFTDERLVDWLLHAEGTLDRPAVVNTARPDLWRERQAESLGTVEPWTWMEWAVVHDRSNVARALAQHGWRLHDGFEAAYLPAVLPPSTPSAVEAAWPVQREARVRQVEPVRLTETVVGTSPAPVVRARTRL